MTHNKENEFDPRSHIGETHGIYMIVDMLNDKDKYSHHIYVAECKECGYKKYAPYGKIHGESSKAHICSHLLLGGGYKQTIRWNNKRLQKIYARMKQRCYNKNDKNYKWYGAKGIKICDKWLNNPLSFEKWSLQNGYEDNLTIDRIDENANYSPDNCRWITDSQNAKYKSTTSVVNVDGEEHTGKDWARILGLSVNIINIYIKKYGLDNTKEFIRRFKHNPNKHPEYKQSYYDLYMN